MLYVSLTSILIQFCASLCTIWLSEQFSICLLIQHTCITNVWSISLKYICHTEGEGELEEFKDLYFGHDGAEGTWRLSATAAEGLSVIEPVDESLT